jgi:hypothetical protein
MFQMNVQPSSSWLEEYAKQAISKKQVASRAPLLGLLFDPED